MSGVKGFYTKDDKVRPVTKRHGHIPTMQKGTASLNIPKRTTLQIQSQQDSQTYQEALVLMEKQAAKYPNKNEYYASEEYKRLYPQLQTLRNKEAQTLGSKGQDAMDEVGIKEGDKVEYSTANPFGQVFSYEGTVKLDKDGVPFVHLNAKTVEGKTKIRWHKGFKKINGKLA